MSMVNMIFYDSITLTPENCVIKDYEKGLGDSENNEELIVKVDATHAGYVNRNFYKYNSASVKAAASSWTTPYQLSVLKCADAHMPSMREPIGKVIDYSYKRINKPKEGDPAGKIVLTLKINDIDSIKKIQDGRYQTVSVGSKAKEVTCSICGGPIGWDHEHELGKEYDGKICYWDIKVDRYREISFTNIPADASENHVARVTEVLTPEESEKLDNNSDNDISTFYWDNYEDTLSEYEAQGVFEDKKLTKKERDALPDSAFCGPKRSFINIDKGHITAGLGMLGVYKGTGNKDTIRACLIKYGKKYGMKFDKKKKDNEDTIGVSDMEDTKKEDFKKLQKDLDDSVAKVKTLEDTIKGKDAEIKSLSEKLKTFEDSERSQTIAKIIDLKVKLSSKDMKDYIEETDDKEKEKLYKKLEDSFSEKSNEELLFVVDSLSNIEIPVENSDTVSDVDAAAEESDSNVVIENKEDNEEDSDLDKKFME